MPESGMRVNIIAAISRWVSADSVPDAGGRDGTHRSNPHIGIECDAE